MTTFDADGLTYHARTMKTKDSIKDDVYTDLMDIILDDLKESDVREALASMANIYHGDEPMAEKYALIADIFDTIVEDEAQKRWDELVEE